MNLGKVLAGIAFYILLRIIRDGSPIVATEFKYSTDPSLESAAIGSKKVKKNKKTALK